ncbi:L,D-transpeptidase family protein [Paracoccus sp. S-4012]|uniref:L,D-transpeptidase n=1 Tax=Paracoccus sp. S-4012 TaxID=2665648 RepID=UPI0012AFB019|nr:L,D-transpeptidase [Paracoccus sp. S-4012]MRX50894.1 L,D-transpeptidase family protein [Paracoccus sp. S-4012]
MRIAAPLALAVAAGLAACAPTTTADAPSVAAPSFVPSIYQARVDTGPRGEPVDIPAVNPAYLNERNQRQRVPYNGPEGANTLVVDPYARFLYHVHGNGEATRYGIAVGQAGRNFAGTGSIQRKAEWPSWTPTANMVRQNPELYGPFAGGVAGGVDNPLGSRALYLYQGGRDTMYRIHGTMDPSSIGRATSAGCIRLFNQDIMDLYAEVPRGATVKVRTEAESRRLEGPLTETPSGYLVPAGEPAMTLAEVPGPSPTVVAAASPVESAVPPRRR